MPYELGAHGLCLMVQDLMVQALCPMPYDPGIMACMPYGSGLVVY